MGGSWRVVGIVLLLAAGQVGTATAGEATPAVIEEEGGAAVPMFRGDPAHSGIHPGPGPSGEPAIAWEVDLGENAWASPVVADGLVVVSTLDLEGEGGCVLHARDAGDGSERWRFTGGCGTPAIADGVLFVAVEVLEDPRHGLVALDLGTGVERWRVETAGRLGFGLVVAGGTIYAGGEDEAASGRKPRSGVAYAFEAATGRERWRASVGDEEVSSLDAVDSTPAVAAGGVYFGIDHSGMYGLDAADGTERWHFRPGASMLASPAAVNGMVYNGAGDGYVYALDPGTGDMRWRFDAGSSVDSSPAVAGGTVFIGGCETPVEAEAAPDDGGECRLFAIDARSGRLRWRSAVGPGFFSSPAVVDGVVYIGGGEFGGEGEIGAGGRRGGALYAFDTADGKERWRVAMGPVLSSPAVVGGRVYVADWDGVLYAIGSAGEGGGAKSGT